MPDAPQSRTLTGGCACGQLTFQARGEPKRVGLCHCMTCRKAHSSAFNPFVVFKAEQVEISGELSSWKSSEHYNRRFCPACGSRVAGFDDDGGELELSLGSFDEVGAFAPGHESWVARREPWLPETGLPQYPGNRPSSS